MNLLVLCPHFRPDLAPTGEIMTALVERWAAAGHRLHVVTALPWYEHHRIEPGWGGRAIRRERTPWGRITRVHPFPTDKANIPARALAFGGFTALAAAAAVAGAERGGRPDGVLAMSPPLTLGLAGWAAARRWRAPFVFNIQDVFPDVAVELGVLKGARMIHAFHRLERFCYLRADAVTVLSDELAANVEAKLGDRRLVRGRRRVRVIPNFVDAAAVAPGPKDNAYRAEHGLGDRPVVMYAGNVGMSQSLELVLHAAARRPDALFVINGGGAARAGLEAQAQQAGLANVRFVGYQPKERLAEVLSAADVHVVPLRAGLARASVPSKLYSVLAAGRPVVASVDPGTEVARTIERAGAGLAVAPEDPEAFTAALARLLDAPDEAERMGKAGRAFVEGWASPAAVAQAYVELFAELR
ncbi:MAG: glycosyltransferase family 4 protein [Acidimicrobiales bacterium]